MNELGSLSHCVVENDSHSRSRAALLRGQSLLISVAFEAAIVAVLLLMPLLTPGILPPVFTFTPAPPYPGDPHPVSRSSPAAAPRGSTVQFIPVEARPILHTTEQRVTPPDVSDLIGAQENSSLSQLGIPGGTDRGSFVSLAPPPASPQTKPLAQSEGVMAARLIRRVQPDYPPIAKLMRLSGVVRLRAIIGTDGSVRQLQVLSGNSILAHAAIAAVRQWRYEPTRLNDQRVDVETSITVTFVLN